MNGWQLLGEGVALILTVLVGVVGYLLSQVKGYEVEKAAALEAVKEAGSSMIVTTDREGA